MQRAPHFPPHIVDVHRILGASEPYVHWTNLTFGHRHQANTHERQALVDGGGVLLIATQSIQPFGQHHIEAARFGVTEQFLHLRPQEQRRTGCRWVGIAPCNRPVLVAQDEIPTETQLIVDGRPPLFVSRVSSVDRDARHHSTLCIPVAFAKNSRAA